MPATAGILNGTDLLVYDNTSKIAYSQSCKLALNMNLRNTSNKDSAGWETNLTGEKSWSVEVSGLVALDTAYNLAYFMNLILNGSTVALKFKTANSSDYYYSGTAYLTSCNVEASNQANVTYSLSLKGTGALALNGSTP
jgi:TP901-1 family phage major tail protein